MLYNLLEQYYLILGEVIFSEFPLWFSGDHIQAITFEEYIQTFKPSSYKQTKVAPYLKRLFKIGGILHNS